MKPLPCSFSRNECRRLVFGVIAALVATASVGCNHVESDWGQAKQANSVPAYTDFIAKHPNATQVEQAKLAIQAIDWDHAKQANSVPAFTDFISKHPNAAQVEQAKLAIAAAHAVRIVITPLTPDYGHNQTIDTTDYASIASNLSHTIKSRLPAGYSVSDKTQEANTTVSVRYSNDLSYADFPQARMYHVSINGDVALIRNGTTVVTKHFSSGRTEAIWPYLKGFSVEAYKKAIDVSGYNSAVGEIMNTLKGL